MRTHVISRREALRLGATAVGASALGGFTLGCHGADSIIFQVKGNSRLTATRHAPTGSIAAGFTTVDVNDPYRNVHIYVPPSYDPAVAAPLVMMYHWTGGDSTAILQTFSPWADTSNLVLVAFSAFAGTFDAVIGNFGPDVEFTNVALNTVFDRCNIDAGRMGVAGFSSGATYALAMGLANGDLFTRIASFSPGNLLSVSAVGKPGIFVSHGTQDDIYTIDSASRPIVKELQKEGYTVDYHEFAGGHQVSSSLTDVAMPWLAAAR